MLPVVVRTAAADGVFVPRVVARFDLDFELTGLLDVELATGRCGIEPVLSFGGVGLDSIDCSTVSVVSAIAA